MMDRDPLGYWATRFRGGMVNGVAKRKDQAQPPDSHTIPRSVGWTDANILSMLGVSRPYMRWNRPAKKLR
jgi:hypothetical protein